MIIKVKHAPTSKWCLEILISYLGDFHKIVEMTIEIDTDKPIKAPCGGRAWLVLDESRDEVARVLEVDSVLNYVCEHTIEIGD